MLDKLKHHPKVIEFKHNFPNINAIIVIFALIMLWRGTWGLLDKYLLPDAPTLSYLLCIVLGAVVLYLDDINLDNLKRKFDLSEKRDKTQ